MLNKDVNIFSVLIVMTTYSVNSSNLISLNKNNRVILNQVKWVICFNGLKDSILKNWDFAIFIDFKTRIPIPCTVCLNIFRCKRFAYLRNTV